MLRGFPCRCHQGIILLVTTINTPFLNRQEFLAILESERRRTSALLVIQYPPELDQIFPGWQSGLLDDLRQRSAESDLLCELNPGASACLLRGLTADADLRAIGQRFKEIPVAALRGDPRISAETIVVGIARRNVDDTPVSWLQRALIACQDAFETPAIGVVENMAPLPRWQRLLFDGQERLKKIISGVGKESCVPKDDTQASNHDPLYHLTLAVRDPDVEVRCQALRELATHRDRSLLPLFIEALKDREPWVRHLATKAMWGITDELMVDPLIEALHDPDNWVSAGAAATLTRIPRQRAAPALLQTLSHPFPRTRAAACAALGRINAPDTALAILQLLKDSDPYVRRNAAGALGKIKKPEAEPDLISALQDEWYIVRRNVAAALGRCGNYAAIVPLENLLNDKQPAVRHQAMLALAELHSRISTKK